MPNELPREGYVRLSEIIGPGRPIPFKKSKWWQGVRDGVYPKPVKLSPNVTAWRVEEIRDLIRRLGLMLAFALLSLASLLLDVFTKGAAA